MFIALEYEKIMYIMTTPKPNELKANAIDLVKNNYFD